MFIIISTTLLFSIIFALLGCIALWKKYLYFSDGLSHSSLLIVAISIIVGIPLLSAGLIISVIFALLIFKFQEFSGKNESVTIITNIMLALALVMINMTTVKIDMMQLLFGDIISANLEDFYTLIVLLIITVIFIICYYEEIILIVLNREIAQIKGIKVKKIEFIFLVILSLSIFSAIKIVGALLVSTILLLPPLTAKIFAKEPKQMLILSVIISLMTCIFGLSGAFYLEMPIAPIIVLVGGIFYISIFLISHFLYKK